jgi:C_GCAxxG_C_C family probable redox protein
VNMDSFDEKYQPMIERAAELASLYEVEYFGCSQSTLAALIEAFGIGGRDILRAATAFSGGVVRRGNVCGALSGGLMMIGFLAGRDDLQMKEQAQRGMGYADKLCQRFEDAYGSVVCREIQKKKYGRSFDLRRDEDREALHAIMAKDPEACQGLTRDAARWTGEIVAEILQEGPPMARMLA